MDSAPGSQSLPAEQELRLGRLASNPGVGGYRTEFKPPSTEPQYQSNEPYASKTRRLIDPRIESSERTRRSIW